MFCPQIEFHETAKRYQAEFIQRRRATRPSVAFPSSSSTAIEKSGGIKKSTSFMGVPDSHGKQTRSQQLLQQQQSQVSRSMEDRFLTWRLQQQQQQQVSLDNYRKRNVLVFLFITGSC